MKIKKDKFDRLFSTLIRERADFTCEHCELKLRGDPGRLDAAHIMGRRSMGLRWHPQNAVALCKKDHLYFTEHPFDWADWIRSYLGEDVMSELRRQSTIPVHWIKADKDEIYEHMKLQYDMMMFQRASGVTGRIEFQKHDIMATIGIPEKA